MRTQPSRILVLTLWLTLAFGVSAQRLPLFGELPQIRKSWKLCEEGKSGDSPVDWHWVVLTNAERDDVLSFAAHKLSTGEKRQLGPKPDLIYLSDTACEIFPGGYPVWPSSAAQRFTTYPIRNGVTKLHLMDSIAKRDLSQEALEYSFVQEQESGTNRMAHGYALVFEDVSVYVQHTSTRPITWEFAHEMATELISIHSKQKPAAKQ